MNSPGAFNEEDDDEDEEIYLKNDDNYYVGKNPLQVIFFFAGCIRYKQIE